jgi:hypothetical protein
MDNDRIMWWLDTLMFFGLGLVFLMLFFLLGASIRIAVSPCPPRPPCQQTDRQATPKPKTPPWLERATVVEC